MTTPLRGPARPVSVTRAVAAFLIAGLAALTAVAAVLALAQHRAATAEAIRDARTLTNLEATDVIGPLLNDAALVPGPAHDALDEVVRGRVLGSHIVRVKIWDATGQIVYSDDKALIGERFTLPADELEALHSGRTEAEVTNLKADENRAERQFGKLVQVYQGVQTPEGTRLLFETYQPYDVVTKSSQRMWRTSLPILLGGLVLLYLVQAPLAYRMARRLQRSQDEREALLVASLAASDRERARIAADLHDGIVQGLTGASFTLTAAADRAGAQGEGPDASTADTMRETARDLRRWVRELRSLVVTIAPPTLHAQGLAASLHDLAATLEVRGITTTVDVDDGSGLEPEVEALLYRAAQEAVRNVVRHADANSASISLHRAASELTLVVRDNGRGLDPAQSTSARGRGSVGLELLTALVADSHGTLSVVGHPEGGTELRLTLPVPIPVPIPVSPPASPPVLP